MPIRRENWVAGKLVKGVTLRIDHPKTNVFNLELCLELIEALQVIGRENEARVVVLQGQGRCFSTGVDILEHTPEIMPVLLPAFHQIFDELLNLHALTIAAVHGYCLGGAAELAFACDRVIVEEGSKIGFPEISVGCYPPVAMALLPYRANFGAATKMLLSGDTFELEQLVDWGLVNTICNQGELEKALADEINSYADKSPAILAMLCAALHEEARLGWANKIPEFERHYLSRVLPHPDASEGIAAFLEKRKPVWNK